MKIGQFPEQDSCLVFLPQELRENIEQDLMEAYGKSAQVDVAISSKFLYYLLNWYMSHPSVPNESKKSFVGQFHECGQRLKELDIEMNIIQENLN